MAFDLCVETDQVVLAVRDYGGAGRPVVLVHGGPGLNLAMWDEFAELLVGSCRVIAYDQRCHGASQDGKEQRFADFVSDLHEVIARLRLERPVVVGQSWGGWIALSYAACWDEAAGIVAADGPITYAHHPLSDTELAELEVWAVASPIYNFVGSKQELDVLMGRLRASGDFDRFDEAVARRNMRADEGRLRSRWTPREWLQLERLAFADAIMELDPDRIYPRIRCRVLLVGATRGEQAESGRPFSREAVEEVLARQQRVRATWIDAGHALPLEAPQALADAVLHSVSDIDRAPERHHRIK